MAEILTRKKMKKMQHFTCLESFLLDLPILRTIEESDAKFFFIPTLTYNWKNLGCFRLFDIFEALSLEISIIGFLLFKSTLGFLKVIGESDVVSKNHCENLGDHRHSFH